MKGLVIMRNGIPELMVWEEDFQAIADHEIPESPAEFRQEFARLYERLWQQDLKIEYLEKMLGDALSALDIYWAAFAALVEPLPSDLCATPDYIRPLYVLEDPELRSAAAPLLLEHRDRIYREHLALPVRL